VILAPVVLGLVLRYVPNMLYGNTRVYDEPVPYEIMDDFLSEEVIQDLREWIKDERRFATALESAARGVISIGEDEPIEADGSCKEGNFITTDGKTCQFGGRIDIFKHFAIGGGWHGAKETITKLWNSIFSFINYYPDAVNEERIKKLFRRPEYIKKINNVCNGGFKAQGEKGEVKGDVSFRPTQVNIVIVPPGMDLPLHQDNQWYWGVNQNSAPDWLLHVMKESQLFDDIMIPQAQGVAYLHGSPEKPYYENGGRYVFYPEGPGKPSMSLPPKRGQAIIMDGGRMIHGVERTAPGYHVGYMRKGAFNRIEYQGNETWYMMSDDDLVEVFKTSDFRMTFVWRGLCFRDEEERTKFEKHIENEEYTDLNIILKKLEGDLKKRGEMAQKDSMESMGPKAYGKLLLKTYNQYPLDAPDAWFPANYCVLGHNQPLIAWLLSPFCTDIRARAPKNDEYPPAKPFCDPENRERRMTNCPGGYQGHT